MIYPDAEDVVGQIENLATVAVEEVTRRIYANHPELLQRFGEKGKAACREDIHHHLEYLGASLYGEDGGPFREYVLWLASVLESRGVPGSHLLESLQLLRQFFESRLGADQAAPVLDRLQDGIDGLSAPALEIPRFQRLLPTPMAQSQDFLQALLEGNRKAAQETVGTVMRNQGALVDVEISVIQPAMYDIGFLWQRSRITVAQEHMATAISQNVMARLFAEAEFAEPLNRKAVFACVPGNHHSLGLRMVSDAFEVAGWTVQFLGADVPGQDLITQIDHWRPELVGLSISLPGHIGIARDIIRKLRAELGSQCPALLIGGLASNQAEGLWKAVDADLWAANARDTLKEVR